MTLDEVVYTSALIVIILLIFSGVMVIITESPHDPEPNWKKDKEYSGGLDFWDWLFIFTLFLGDD